MRVKLDKAQVDVLLSGLDELISAADAENDSTYDKDIHESNDAKIAEADALYGYLSGYEEREKESFLFSDRRRLADLFDVWAEENRVAKTPEGVIAFLQVADLLDTEAAKGYIKEKADEESRFIRSGEDTFELVDFVPLGYEIWNIGSHMVDGYLPLCRLKAVQPFEGGREIETDTLKAIKCEGAQVILAAIGYGPDTPEKMEKYIAKYSKTGKNARAVQRMEAALPYMRQLKWG